MKSRFVHFFVARVATVLFAFLLWELQKRTPHPIHQQHHIHQVGKIRRAQCLEDEFPTNDWICGVSESRSSSLSEFLQAYLCTWDGKHYIWLAEYGYEPNITASIYLPSGPLGLRLSFKTKNNVDTAETKFLISGLTRPEQSKKLSIGDEVLALNGIPMARRGISADSFGRNGNMLEIRPSQLRWFDPKTAFMPLYPFGLLRTVLLILHFLGAGTDTCFAFIALLSCAMSAASLSIAQSTRKLLVEQHEMSKCAINHVKLVDWVMLMLPSSFFLTTAYSEALYLLLSAIWLWSLVRHNILLASAVGFLLPLSRSVGALAAVPALVFSAKSIFPLSTCSKKHIWKCFTRFAVLISVLFGYTAHSCFVPEAASRAQDAFVAGFSSVKMLRPLQAFSLLAVDFGNIEWHEPTNSLLDRATFLVAISMLLLTIRRLPLEIWAFSFVNLMAPPLAGSLMSYSRFFATGAFPLMWAFRENSCFLALFLCVGVIGQVWLLWRFLCMEWAG